MQLEVPKGNKICKSIGEKCKIEIHYDEEVPNLGKEVDSLKSNKKMIIK